MHCSSSTHWLSFDVANARFAVAAECVEEVLPLGDITPVPLAPSRVRGLINVRGEAVPLLDLAAFLGLAESRRSHTVLICRAARYRVGLLAERAYGARERDAGARRPPRLLRPPRLRDLAIGEVETDDGVEAFLDLDRVLEAARV